MTQPHRHFHEQLTDLQARLVAMAGDAEAALAMAVEALLTRDVGRAEQVMAGDREIDRQEMEVEEECIRLLALQQPMAGDLRLLTATLKISNDLERVGDHAVNIAEAAIRFAKGHTIVPEPELVEMARLTRAMLGDAVVAFIRRDPVAARVVCLRDDRVDALHRSVFRIVLTHMMENPTAISDGMELTSTSRNLERVADLATNIAEDVVFLVEGKSIKHGAWSESEQ
ncbi:MAG: phosphate signaling complex protein PhoU [Gemmatimonadota bacterium]